MRLSKMILSSSVRDGGGVSINIGVVISTVVSAVIVLRVRVVGFGGAALLLVVFVFSVSGSFGPATFLGGLFSFSWVTGLFLLPWSHKGGDGDGDSISGAIVNGDGGFWA